MRKSAVYLNELNMKKVVGILKTKKLGTRPTPAPNELYADDVRHARTAYFCYFRNIKKITTYLTPKATKELKILQLSTTNNRLTTADHSRNYNIKNYLINRRLLMHNINNPLNNRRSFNAQHKHQTRSLNYGL